MAVIRDRITVYPPEGETVVVDILEDDVSLGTAHAERTTTRTLTLPLTITERTSFYVPRDGTYTVSVKLNDIEIAGPGGTTVTASSFPTEVRASIDTTEMGGVVGTGGSSQFYVSWATDNSDPLSLVAGTPSTLTKAFLETLAPPTTAGAAPTQATDGSFLLPAGSYHLYVYGDITSNDPATNGEIIKLRFVADAAKLFVTNANGTPALQPSSTDNVTRQVTADGVVTEYEVEGYARFTAAEDVTVHVEAETQFTDATLTYTTVLLLTV